MAHKLLVTTVHAEELDLLRATGARVLAEYPDATLVLADDAQAADLAGAGLECTALKTVPVRTANTNFDFADAVGAEAEAPLPIEPDRAAYYLAQLIGPSTQDWLAAIEAAGAVIHAALPGYRLLLGAPPARRADIAEQPFIEEVTPYRPAMKLSPDLRGADPDRPLTRSELSQRAAEWLPPRRVVGEGDAAPVDRVQIEVNVFSGEDLEELVTLVRDGGGMVLFSGAQTLGAVVPSTLLVDLAEHRAVASVLPHAFEKSTNDKARAIMGIATAPTVEGTALTGAGQVIGVADSGIDTGNEATLHSDLRGRVTIVSLPSQLAAELTTSPHSDDGAADETAHGTHVAGSIAGNGACAVGEITPRGVAYEARLHFSAIGQQVRWNPDPFTHAHEPIPKPYGLYGLPADLTSLFERAYLAGARIHTNSWGGTDASLYGAYTAKSNSVDKFAFTHRDMLIIFSAGNTGADIDNDGHIEVGSVAPPATAKNCLTVGATENNRPADSSPTPGNNQRWAQTQRYPRFFKAGHVSDNPEGVALFSGRGPTREDRIKPEVVAPGTNVLSVRSSAYKATYIGEPENTEPLWGEVQPATHPLHGLYCWSGGTSMATPLVAGLVALIRQYLVGPRGHHKDGVTPSGALLKAMVVNLAVPIAGQYPGEIPDGRQNNVCGFGRAHLDDSVRAVRFVDDPGLALPTGGALRWQATVLTAGTPMKITLTWTDPPSPAGWGSMQNVLYLRVVAPGGETFDGDVIPFATAIDEARANNTQQVVIADPAPGIYEIKLIAIQVTKRSAGLGAPPGILQDFALVTAGVTGDLRLL